MKRKLLCILISVTMLTSLMPCFSFAAVTYDNDWDIFDAHDNYDLPKTQEQIFNSMISDPNFYSNWITVANALLPEKYNVDDNNDNSPKPYTKFSSSSYTDDLKYTSDGLRGAVSSIVRESNILNGSKVLDSLPEGTFPVFYTSTRASEGYSKWGDGRHATGYGYYIQLFYDFEIEGIQDRFKTPSVEADDTNDDLQKKGYVFSLGGSSDSYQVTAENRNDFENTVEKSYTYEKSTSTSTTVSNTYSENWTEETTIGVEFQVPVLAALSPTAKVEQSFSYSYGIEKTYETSKEESYSQSITDTISVPLPAHTGIKINVDVSDLKTTIPYNGAVRIKYKTKILSVSGYQRDGSNQHHEWKDLWYTSRTFGRDGMSAIEDLDARIMNRNVTGYDPDKVDMSNIYSGRFKSAADHLLSGQPVAPYYGDFHYTSKNTIITPQKVYPLYDLDRIVTDKEDVTLYEQQSMRLDDIKVSALDAYDVEWYGFNSRLNGHWTVIDEDGNTASEYAEITKNRNGHPVLKALKPNDGNELFLRYEPDASIKTTADFNSELIELTIDPVPLSSVTLNGEFETFYLNDRNNTTDVSGLTVSAKDEDDNDFYPSPANIKWYAEESSGISVNEEDGGISFTDSGTYQIYAVVNGTESNRIALQVLPERYLNELSLSGSIPDLIYNDDTVRSYDLTGLEITAKDQYGDNFTLDPDQYRWELSSKNGYAVVNSNTLTGLIVGTDTITLYYPAGTDDNGETIYKISQPLTVKVTAKPYVNELYYNSGAPTAIEGIEYDLSKIPLYARDQHGNSINVPSDIEWKLAENNQTKATIDNGKMTVEQDQVADSSNLEVILEASSPSTGTTAKNVIIKVQQQPVLKTIKVSLNKDFMLHIDENAVLSDHFTAIGYDQYGKEMSGLTFKWSTSKPDVISIENGILKALKEEASDIFARVGDIESNKITVTVNAPRRLTTIGVTGIPSYATKNTSLDLTNTAVKTFDQFNKEFTEAELAAYPASIRWALEKNNTNAVINGNILYFGDKEGKITLICAAANTDTNILAEKRLDININSSGGGSSSGGSGGGGGSSSGSSTTPVTPPSTDPTPGTSDSTIAIGAVTDASGNKLETTAGKDGSVTVKTGSDKDSVIIADIKNAGPGTAAYIVKADGKEELIRSSVVLNNKLYMSIPDGAVIKAADNSVKFADVDEKSWSADAIAFVSGHGLFNGTSADKFSPSASMTREMLMTVIARLNGADTSGDALAKGMAWAVENGISDGSDPKGFITREQIAAMLYRNAGEPEVTSDSSHLAKFSDTSDISGYAEKAMLWAVEAGIINGTTDNRLMPRANATREQVAQMMLNYVSSLYR